MAVRCSPSSSPTRSRTTRPPPVLTAATVPLRSLSTRPLREPERHVEHLLQRLRADAFVRSVIGIGSVGHVQAAQAAVLEDARVAAAARGMQQRLDAAVTQRARGDLHTRMALRDPVGTE